jgi:hypothetical protein
MKNIFLTLVFSFLGTWSFAQNKEIPLTIGV